MKPHEPCLAERRALATLYLRFRAARRQHAERAEKFGENSPVTLVMVGAKTEAWNALQAVRRAIWHPDT